MRNRSDNSPRPLLRLRTTRDADAAAGLSQSPHAAAGDASGITPPRLSLGEEDVHVPQCMGCCTACQGCYFLPTDNQLLALQGAREAVATALHAHDIPAPPDNDVLMWTLAASGAILDSPQTAVPHLAGEMGFSRGRVFSLIETLRGTSNHRAPPTEGGTPARRGDPHGVRRSSWRPRQRRRRRE